MLALVNLSYNYDKITESSSLFESENYKEKNELMEKEILKIKGDMEHLQAEMETAQKKHQSEVEGMKNENSWLHLRVDEEKVKATHAEEEVANLRREKESLEKIVGEHLLFDKTRCGHILNSISHYNYGL